MPTRTQEQAESSAATAELEERVRRLDTSRRKLLMEVDAQVRWGMQRDRCDGSFPSRAWLTIGSWKRDWKQSYHSGPGGLQRNVCAIIIREPSPHSERGCERNSRLVKGVDGANLTRWGLTRTSAEPGDRTAVYGDGAAGGRGGGEGGAGCDVGAAGAS
jgi:hypothetical protein